MLRRANVETAQPMTIKIGKMITDVRSKLLSKATASDTKQLWQLLRNTHNWPHVATNSTTESFGLTLTAKDLNAYFLQTLLQMRITVMIP